MTSSRHAFLERVRAAVEAGNRAGHAPALEPRGATGYQGAGPDIAGRFCERFALAGGRAHRVSTAAEAVTRVLDIVRSKSARSVVLGRSSFLDSLNLAEQLAAAGAEPLPVDKLSPENSRDPLFAAEVGISGADFLIAESGTVVVQARPEGPRSLSLLPPVHLVLAERARLVPDLFDVFDAQRWGEPPSLPSCLTLITGPSKTGDIELRLVTGVHGPGEVHVILVED
jgi:L-lactate dehydrogenase complex protein LldG